MKTCDGADLRAYRQFAIVLWLGLFPWNATASAPTLGFETRLPQLSQRTGQESCWAQFQLKEDEKLCIPHSVWLMSFSPQGIWSGKWKASSPLLLDVSGRKITTYRWTGNASLAPTKTSFPFRGAQALERRREEMAEWLRESHSDPLGIFAQLALGQTSADSSLLGALGFIHLLSFGGIHLLGLIWLAEWLCAILLSPLRIGPALASAFKRMLLVVIFGWSWGLAGGPTRLLRPLVLIGVQKSAKRAGLRLRPAAALLTALFVDLGIGIAHALFQKSSILSALGDPGRIYYFLVVSTLLLSTAKKRMRWELALSAWLVSSVYSMLATHEISLLGAVFSWISIPWFSLVIYPALLLRSVTPIDPSFLLSGTSRAVLWMLQASLKIHALWWISPTSILLALILSSILWMLPRRWRLPMGMGGAALAVMAGFFHVGPAHPESARLDSADHVIQLDVGQGDAALVLDRSGGDIGLIDSGSGRLIGESQWLELLRREGIFRLNWVGLTHLDEDHAGGVLRLSAIVPIDCAATAEGELRSPRGIRWKETLESHGVRVTSLLSECVPFPSLPPAPARPGGHSANENMSAFLVPIRGGGFFVSAGDATAHDELRIGAWARAQAMELAPGPRILKISHHGSKTSSNPAFIRKIAPTEMWISVGVGNHYGHPSPLVLERIASEKIPVHRTDEEGALTSP